ncbi:MAG: zinc-dependent peptidase [Bacteroidota bacterium]|nr:zinc-dependent peptidase [Bacteroidota bacterium]
MEENVFGFIFGALTFLLFILVFIILGVKIAALSFQYFLFNLLGTNPFRHFEFKTKNMEPSHERILLNNFKYYKSMPRDLQPVFKNRVAKFIESKSFETRQKITLNDEMKVLVSACAVQLTFGLADYRFLHFERILIYPEAYYSTITKKFHKGEVNSRGLIVLSWRDFKAGYSDPHDNLNLGLHEFAHALFINFQKNKIDCMNFERYYQHWRDIGDREFFKMRGRKQNYLRQYGATNLMEFFSVSVEHFFEAPNAFKQNLPELYKVLSRFLAQDPTKWMKA